MTKSCPKFLAVDLGASSGRVIAATLQEERVVLDEIHRFPSNAYEREGSFFWDERHLFGEIVQGLAMAVEKFGKERSFYVGIDTWGVDCGLLDQAGNLLASPRQYRDPRSRQAMEQLEKKLGHDWLFDRTGVLSMFVNTSFHLFAEFHLEETEASKAAEKLLFMPDLIAHFLSGSDSVERTIASTSQLLDLRTMDWSKDVLGALHLPAKLFTRPVSPGTRLGKVRKGLSERLDGVDMTVVAVGGHDTASAVGAIPFSGPDILFLSSGTWSIMGMVVPEPILSPEARLLGWSNEAAVGGGVRFLKNLCGMWIIEECRREWEAADGEAPDYEQIVRSARESGYFDAVIDPDDAVFASPGPMEERIRRFCRESGQNEPQNRGEVLRVVFQSLAAKYGLVFQQLESLIGRPLSGIHVVGGGSRNEFLNEMTADSIGKPIQAGPVEATALGNIIVQMVEEGSLPDLDAGRRLIAKSFPVTSYYPEGKYGLEPLRSRLDG